MPFKKGQRPPPRKPKAAVAALEVVPEAPAAESLEDIAAVMAAAGNDVAAEPETYADGAVIESSVLSQDEIAAIRKRALAKLEKERKDAASKQLEAQFMDELRREMGMSTGDSVRDEEVDFTLNLASFADRIVVNGETYMHGRSYRRPRHVAESILEQCFRTHRIQSEWKGETYAEFYQKSAGLKLGASGVIAGQVPGAH